jgi:hypothetical protein
VVGSEILQFVAARASLRFVVEGVVLKRFVIGIGWCNEAIGGGIKPKLDSAVCRRVVSVMYR